MAGELQGEKVEPLGEMNYRYPLVTSEQIYLWPDYYPYAYYSDYPWWYYDPWWEYPYGGWGFGFHYHHHHHHHHHHDSGIGTGRSFSPPSQSGRPGFLGGIFGSRGLSGGRSGSSSGGDWKGHK